MSDRIKTGLGQRHVGIGQDGLSRRGLLKCAAWAGAGVVWTISGGVPRSMGLADALAATSADGLTFVQISDTHIGFNKPANPHTADTMAAAVSHIAQLPTKPSFLIHTGDITHLSKPAEFDMAQQIIKGAHSQVHYVPGEHDWLDDGQGFRERHGQGTKGDGWYSFDSSGVHFIGLINVVGFKAGSLTSLGPDQLAWLKDDVSGHSSSTPIVVFAHIPLWAVYPSWGWATQDSAQALEILKRFGSVTVLNGHIHQVLQKVEGNVTFHTARSTAYPQPAPGTAKSPGPLKVPAEKLRSVLGVREVTYQEGQQPLAIVDTPLSA
jgi:3',5'-cyclic AMP phosphodiesterase CpdA